MTAIMYRPRTRAEVVALLAAREEIEQREEMQAAFNAWNGGPVARAAWTAEADDYSFALFDAPPPDVEMPLRRKDRLIIGAVIALGCALWLLEIARIARGVWWR